jgi:hypothetical protein
MHMYKHNTQTGSRQGEKKYGRKLNERRFVCTRNSNPISALTRAAELYLYIPDRHSGVVLYNIHKRPLIRLVYGPLYTLRVLLLLQPNNIVHALDYFCWSALPEGITKKANARVIRLLLLLSPYVYNNIIIQYIIYVMAADGNRVLFVFRPHTRLLR